MAQKKSTAPASLGSANTSSKNRGRECERLVLKKLMAEGYHFIAQNTSIHGVEVDLLVKKDILYMVEVKAIRSFAETHFRVTKKQINRLLYARQILQDRDGELTELLIAFVCGKEVVLLRINELLGL